MTSTNQRTIIVIGAGLAGLSAARKIKAGKAVSYNPYNNPVRERIRIKRRLESAIHDLYLSIVLESLPGIPLPH